MTTDAKDRTETLAQHRATIERARAALYDAPNVDQVLYPVRSAFDAVEALAHVSLTLWGLAVVTELPGQEAGEDELTYRKVRQIAPMREKVAHAVLAHADALKKTHKAIHAKVCDHQEIIQELTSALAGYGPDVDFPVIEAAKTLDLSHEGEA